MSFVNGSPVAILQDTGKWFQVRVGNKVGSMLGFGWDRWQALPPSPDAAHIYNATVALPYGNLEPATTSPGTIDEESATAIDPPDIPKTTIA